MNRIASAILAGGMLLSPLGAQAGQAPPPQHKTPDEHPTEQAMASKAAEAAAKTAAELDAAMERAVANYRRNIAQSGAPATAANAQK
jgi:hypothetical protein